MAEDKDQKTHAPTEKRLADARAKGDVATAPEVRQAAMFAALIVVTGTLGSEAAARIAGIAASLWGGADAVSLDPDGAQAVASGLLGQVAIAVLPILAILFGCALIGGLAQGRPTLAWSRLSPKWSKLNPLSGLTRMFAPRALVEFGKTLIKLLAVGGVAALVLRPFTPGFETMVGLAPTAIGALAHGIVAKLLTVIALLVGGVALFDLVYQRISWLKKMRMSLKELKDEFKQQEGDPKIKAKIRQIGMQRARRRMMAAVPKATVVITNPTHFAVALSYDHGAMAAPIVVAKGTDAVALRIREIATANGVPLVENRPLARALHASAEIDRPIPIEHFAAVAEVISYVLKLARVAGKR